MRLHRDWRLLSLVRSEFQSALARLRHWNHMNKIVLKVPKHVLVDECWTSGSFTFCQLIKAVRTCNWPYTCMYIMYMYIHKWIRVEEIYHWRDCPQLSAKCPDTSYHVQLCTSWYGRWYQLCSPPVPVSQYPPLKASRHNQFPAQAILDESTFARNRRQ